MNPRKKIKRKMKICYHGTNKRNAGLIMKKGFKKWTYFARHLEDAIGYGGRHVFEVAFDDEADGLGWQFMIRKALSPDKIISLQYFPKPRSIFGNEKLREDVFESNIHQRNGVKKLTK